MGWRPRGTQPAISRRLRLEGNRRVASSGPWAVDCNCWPTGLRTGQACDGCRSAIPRRPARSARTDRLRLWCVTSPANGRAQGVDVEHHRVEDHLRRLLSQVYLHPASTGDSAQFGFDRSPAPCSVHPEAGEDGHLLAGAWYQAGRFLARFSLEHAENAHCCRLRPQAAVAPSQRSEPGLPHALATTASRGAQLAINPIVKRMNAS